MEIIAIHQPNFFPWLGYFKKIIESDIFIFLDDVQFSKKGGTWSNRVKLLISGEAKWLTGAIDRNYEGVRTIREMHFLEKSPWREKILKSIAANYNRHPYYAETMEFVEPLIMNTESNVAHYNMRAVNSIANRLGIDTSKFVRSSQYPTSSSSNELLCTLTKIVGGDTYLCGGGADGYQDSSIFERHNIKLLYQNYCHPVYSQIGTNDFVSGLSIIDALMNIGMKETRKILLA